jgi:hypothetical protein
MEHRDAECSEGGDVLTHASCNCLPPCIKALLFLVPSSDVRRVR